MRTEVSFDLAFFGSPSAFTKRSIAATSSSHVGNENAMNSAFASAGFSRIRFVSAPRFTSRSVTAPALARALSSASR